jgi:hypothetical protein
MAADVENSLQIEEVIIPDIFTDIYYMRYGIPSKGFKDGWRIDGRVLKPELSRNLTISYFIGGAAVSAAVSILIWTAVSLFAKFSIGASAFLTVCALLTLSSVVAGAFMTMFVAATRSKHSVMLFCFVSTIFLCVISGILPISDKPVIWRDALSSLIPFTHFSIWIKQTVLDASAVRLGWSADIKAEAYKFFTARDVGFVGADAPPALIWVYIAAFTVACLLIADRLMAQITECGEE